MAFPVGLDLDVLRSFVVIAEEKSFTRAADLVGRTQSAVSLQMQRLEAALGQTLLHRSKGGAVELSPQGQYLLVRARELLALNDDIVKSVRAVPVQGVVRLGIADEIAARFLVRILERFAEQAPTVEVDVVTAVSCALGVKLKNGEVDLAIIEGGLEPRQWPATVLWRQPLRWVTSDYHRQHLRDPLPLTVSPADCQWRPSWMTECLWRGRMLSSLDQAGRRYRIVSTSGTTAGQIAAVSAGLAVTCVLPGALPESVRLTTPDEGLPELPETSFLMLKAREPRQPITDMLAAQIHEVFGAPGDMSDL